MHPRGCCCWCQPSPTKSCRQEHPCRWHASQGSYKGSLVTSVAPAGPATDTLVLLPAPCGGVSPRIRQGHAPSRVPIPAKGVQDPEGWSRGAQALSKAELLQNTLTGLSLPPAAVCVGKESGWKGQRADALSAGEGGDKLLPFSFQMWSQTLTSHPSISSCWPRALLMRR